MQNNSCRETKTLSDEERVLTNMIQQKKAIPIEILHTTEQALSALARALGIEFG
ncbi:MAG: hypothetical protein ACI9QC_000517 [Oceanicoccus sp.]|jgi:hypothetical protein